MCSDLFGGVKTTLRYVALLKILAFYNSFVGLSRKIAEIGLFVQQSFSKSPIFLMKR
jgi:hypothetical protein